MQQARTAPAHESPLISTIAQGGQRFGRELELEPDHVYVISPNHKLEISDISIGRHPI